MFPVYEITTLGEFRFKVIPFPMQLSDQTYPCLILNSLADPIITITPDTGTNPIEYMDLCQVATLFKKGKRWSWNNKLVHRCELFLQEQFLIQACSTYSIEEAISIMQQTPFTHARQRIAEWIVELSTLHAAANRIQKQYRLAISDPKYMLCHNRLLHEFTDLSKENSLIY